MYTKRQIIHLTEGRYFAPRSRSLDERGAPCLLNYQGRRSPVGHCLQASDELPHHVKGLPLAEFAVQLDPRLGRYSVARLRHMVVGELDERLLSCYRGHELGFWMDLEEWHANGAHFTDYGLSAAGRAATQVLLRRWSADQTTRALRVEAYRLPRSEREDF